jgi:predicted O-linked N-acetylglucosamine transferase (SPINDLY family)
MNARNPVFVAMENQEQAPPIGLDTLFTTCEQLQQAGQAQQALDMYQSWLAQSQDANRHMAWFNYGSLQQSTGHPAAAIEAYKECLVLQPSFPQALINLGLTLEKMGKRDEALQQWATLVSKRLLKDGPSSDMLVLALNHIGRVQEDLKQYDMAEEALEQSLALNPKQPGVIQHWVHIRQKACAWPVYKPLPNITQNEMLMATSPLAMLALTDDPVQQLLTAFAFVERTYGFKEEFLSKGREYRHDRLRIGYVSGDLCVHAVGLLLPELLEGHDKSKFEIYGYDFSPEDGTAHRERLKKAFDHLRPIRALTDRQVAELVMADEIDVLIDLHGLSSGARPGIFALHPAPKQGTYLGFIGTTGMPWFDFVIADRYALPEELTPYFTEKPLYVEGSFIPLTRDDTPVREATRAEFGLPDDAFVMAAFGNVYKITPEMFATWMEILKEIPRAVLWLIDDNPTTTANIKKHAISAKADVSRILFTGRSAHVEYKAKLKLADVFLDTFPYNCGSTTNDVINADIPMVTMSGRTMVSKMGKSILNRIGRNNLITNSREEYTRTVCALSNSLDTEQTKKTIQKDHQLSNSLDIENKLLDKTSNQFDINKNASMIFSAQKFTERPLLSLITHHYNGHEAAGKLVSHLEKLPYAMKNKVELIIIDDYSDVEKPIDSNLLNLKQYRIINDIQWNQAGARNLGALMASGSWSLFFDIDQEPNILGITKIVENLESIDPMKLYYFYVESFIDSNLNVELPIHPNTFLVNTERFKSTCMYDEDFAGNYGYEDLYLPYVWEKSGGSKTIYDNEKFFKDKNFKTTSLNRDLSINRALAEKKLLNGAIKPTNLIRFQWKEI